MLKNVKKAYEHLVAELKKLEEVATKAGDTTTSNIAQDKYGELEKTLWMINQTLA